MAGSSRPMPGPSRLSTNARLGRLGLGASLVMTAFNLRPVFSSLSVVLPDAMRDLAMSPLVASLLTTLPVLCLGLFAPAAPGLAQRFGAERVMLALLLTMAAGTALRGLATLPALLVGSVVAGASIAVVNVLLPGLVKRDFPDHAPLLTGLFTMALCGGAATAAGTTVPFEHAFGGWATALALWGVPPLVTALVWAPQVIRLPATRPAVQPARTGLWREPLAWQVTLFMGFQAALAYCVFGWLAPILRERGLDAIGAGYVVSVSVFAQMAACLVAPTIATRSRDQRAIGIAMTGLAVAGFLGCLFGPMRLVWVAAVVQGAGQGALIAVVMTLIILRSPDIRTAARLSGMAQGLGYLMGAAGPFVVGLIRERTGGFAAASWFLVALGVGSAVTAWNAGRDRVLAV